MAFSSFGTPSGMGMGGGGNGNVTVGADLQDITTSELGFLSTSGEARVQLLPTPWPDSNLPAPTSSLMTVAPRKGLVAAAGPDIIVLAKTESVRKAFEAPKVGTSHTRPFQPELKIPMPMRVSQLAFTADEEYLVASAETGGGLAVYAVQSLLQGSTQSAFEIGTNGLSLRALIPNPTAEKGELLALVTTDGKLMMANLKDKSFILGNGQQILKEGVSCISWSAKGKQLVAGLGDGTATQMTPDGVVKAEIPKPTTVSNNWHMSSITWLENNVFLVIHTETNGNTPPESIFHIATRQEKTTNFDFQKIADPAGPFGMERFPPHYWVLRLRDFPPALQDILLITSTAATDIGLFTRSKTPMAANAPTGVFTLTELSDDTRRAGIPSNESWSSTSPIGFCLDLSAKETVYRPIKGHEIDESKTPLPSLMLLNNEGVLVSWWIVYTASVEQQTIYPGLAAAPASIPQASPAPTQQQSAVTPFGSQSAPTAFGAQTPVATPFGASKPAFGAPAGQFGAASGLGQRQSVWGAPSAAATTPSTGFGKITFGTSTAPANPAFGSTTPAFSSSAAATPAFGSTGFTGAKASPWGSAATTSPSTAFGQATSIGQRPSVFGSTPAASAFGSAAPPSGSGFASFASTSTTGFGAAAGSKESVFGSKPASNAFGSTPSTGALGSTPSTNAFGTPATNDNKPGLFGSEGFKLSSGFKPDESDKKETKSNEPASNSFFGNKFGSVLPEVDKTPGSDATKDGKMDETGEAEKAKEEAPKPTAPAVSSNTTGLFGSSAPTSKPATNSTAGFSFGTPKPSLFGDTKPSTTPANPFGKPAESNSSSTPSANPFAKSSTPVANPFGKPVDMSSTSTPLAIPSTKPGDTGSTSTPLAKPFGTTFGQLSSTPSPAANPFSKTPATPHVTSPFPSTAQTPATPPSKVKDEPRTEDSGLLSNIPEAPLPPDTSSKAIFTSTSSSEVDAPLPPDFVPVKKPIPSNLIPPSDVPGGPDDDEDSGFDTEEGEEAEGSADDFDESGEDVTKDLSPTSDGSKTQSSPNMSPENTFTKIERPVQSSQSGAPRGLFGEVSRQGPVLPPPSFQISPRSPSPIRSAVPRRLMRPEASRSVSAPGMASQILGAQKPSPSAFSTSTQLHGQSTFEITAKERAAEEKRRAESRARKEAEEAQALEDDEDQNRQDFINSDLEPTTKLDEFLAHVGVGTTDEAGPVPAQVESVYRDINSMIDTLGLNARALKCFIKGQSEFGRDEYRTKADLENPDDWCFAEIEALSAVVESELAKDLEDGRVKDVAGKLEACNELQKDLVKLQARHRDIRKIISAHNDIEQLAISRQQPLSTEQATQQHDLRRNFTNLQKLLTEVEESLIVLKAKTVSQNNSNGKSASGGGPTVEAVMRTIGKMTAMAEKRSGDIDVLEGQMRKLRFSSVASESREGSPQPFSTPQSNRTSLRNPGNSTYGLFYTPDSIRDDRRGLQNSFMSSTSSHARGSPGPRKKMSGYSMEEKAQLRGSLAKKNDVKARLKAAAQKVGTTIRVMKDD